MAHCVRESFVKPKDYFFALGKKWLASSLAPLLLAFVTHARSAALGQYSNHTRTLAMTDAHIKYH